MVQQWFTYDGHRAHSNFILNWLVKMGYNKLCTDFAQFQDNLTSHLNPPPERLNIPEAKQVWTEFWSGRLKLNHLVNEGDQWVFACPEGKHEDVRLLCRLLQENVLMMHALKKDFKIALLINIHRLPFADDTHEDLNLGKDLYENEFLSVHMMPLIDNVIVMSPQAKGQFGQWSGKAVVRSSYYGLIVFSSMNQGAKELVRNMQAGIRDSSPSLAHMPNWGAHRADMPYLVEQYRKGYDTRLMLWEWSSPKLPKWLLAVNTTEVVSTDLLQQVTKHVVEVEEYHKASTACFFSQPNMKQLYPGVHVNTAVRRSWGHWSKDKLWAWDLSIGLEEVGQKVSDSASSSSFNNMMRDLFSYLGSQYYPMSGGIDIMSIDCKDIGQHAVYMEIGNSQVIQDLLTDGVIGNSVFVMKKLVAVLHKDGFGLAEPEKLHKFVQQIQAYISKQSKQDLKEHHKYVNYIVVSTHPDVYEPIKQSGLFPSMKGRVVFDRHDRKDGGESASAPPKSAAQSSNELLVQLQDFPGMDQDLRAQIVKDVVCKFLDRISAPPADGSATDGSRWVPFVQVLHDVRPSLPYGWLKIIATPEACKSLSAKLQMTVVLHHGTGTIRFHSHHFPLSGKDLAAQFQGLQLMDRTPDFPSGGNVSYSGPSCAPSSSSAAGLSSAVGSSSSAGPSSAADAGSSSAAAAAANSTWLQTLS